MADSMQLDAATAAAEQRNQAFRPSFHPRFTSRARERGYFKRHVPFPGPNKYRFKHQQDSPKCFRCGKSDHQAAHCRAPKVGAQSQFELPLSNRYAPLRVHTPISADEKPDAVANLSDEEFMERWLALKASHTRAELDVIFGVGRDSYIPDFNSPDFIAFEKANTPQNKSTAVANHSAPANVNDIDALIAYFKALDKQQHTLPDPEKQQHVTRPSKSTQQQGARQPEGGEVKQKEPQPGKKKEPETGQSNQKTRRKLNALRNSTQAQNKPDNTEDNLMFDKECFAALQKQLKVPCTVDACASDDGSNALLPDYCCPANSFFDRSFVGNTPTVIFMHPPREGREAFLVKYKANKLKNPTLGACILLPAKYSNPLLRGMHLIHRYPRNSSIFTDPVTGKAVKCKLDFVVYVDAPSDEVPLSAPIHITAPATTDNADENATEQRPVTTHAIQAPGTVAGIPVQVLFDSGAESYNLLSTDFCNKYGIKVQTPKKQLQIQGMCEKGSVSGTSNLKLTIQGISWKLLFHVVDMPQAFDVILGDAWFKQNRASLSYPHNWVTGWHGSKQFKLHMQQPIPDPGSASSTQSTAKPAILSYAQAVRFCKQPGVEYCLVLVKEKPVAQPAEVPDSNAVPSDSTDPRVADLKEKYSDVFTDKPPHGGSQISIDFEVIPVEPGSKPIYRPMYRYSPLELEEMEKQIKLLLELGYIQPSVSGYGAPVLFVKKPRSTELRMVCDYRALNKITKRINFPLPRIDQLLDHLAGAKVFSLIDLRQAYHQVKLQPEDVPKTCFRTPFGSYEYVTLSFGLVNAPAAFQAVMQRLFGKYMYKFVLIYLDDILVYSKDEAEHAAHLDLVMNILRENKLTAALHKCSFYQKEALYLGHIISGDGIKADPAKVKAIVDFPVPTDVSHLRSFLGMATYFRKFIKHFAQLTNPLTALLRKNVMFKWTQRCQQAYDLIKRKLTTAPLLVLPDWRSDAPFDLVCDASMEGLGGVLLQHGKPIAFESRKLTAAELNYSPTELEMLAVVYCVKKWRCYIEGRDIQVYTNHKPNTYFDSSSMQTRRAARWLDELQGYRLNWNYKPGPQNVVADALSRNPVCGFTCVQHVCMLQSDAIETSDQTPPAILKQITFLDAVKSAYMQDSAYSDKRFLAKLTEKEGLYYHGSQLALPDIQDLRTAVISECHDTVYSGHVGRTKTLHNLQRYFWWPYMHADVKNFVASCDSCQRNKSSNRKPFGLLRPLQIPEDTWESVSFDLITSLPQTASGATAIVVFVDRLSKMVHLAPCRDDTGAEGLADIFLNTVFKLHGLPRELVSDRDPRFTSKLWQSLLKRLGVTQAMSSAYHPQTDGNTERVNRVLEDMLRHFIDSAQSNWEQLLPCVEFAINNSYHESIKAVPFELNYGKRPKLPLDLLLKGEAETGESRSVTADNLVHRIHSAVKEAKACLQAAQQRQKAYADKNKANLQADVGSEVMLSTKHIKLKMKGVPKLLPRWIGPFKVVKKINDVTFKLEMPPSLQIHPVFHSSLLKLYIPGRCTPPPPPEILDGECEYEVEDILDHQDVPLKKKRNRAKTPVYIRKYLVKWKGYDHSYNTWEPADNCANCPEIIKAYEERVGQGVAQNKGVKRHQRKDVHTNRQPPNASGSKRQRSDTVTADQPVRQLRPRRA